MKLAALAAALVAAVVVVSSNASAAKLNVGDAAPSLTVGKWVKGKPVQEFEKGKIYVVEFWATWCGPCKASIPHLTQLAKSNPEVTFIGTSIWENDQALVEPFVAEMGEKMDYHVAMDDMSASERGAMSENWMDAASMNSIPTAFIVNRDGQIAWMGLPMKMEQALQEVIAGNYDMERAKQLAAEETAKREAEMALRTEMNERLAPLVKEKNYDAAVAAIDQMLIEKPEGKAMLNRTKFSLLVRADKYDEAYRAADVVAEAKNDDAESLNELAWFIVDNKAVKNRDLDRALKYVTQAVSLTEGKEAGILDTLARVQFEKGQVDQAIQTQTKAVEIADEGMKADLQKSLATYQAAKK